MTNAKRKETPINKRSKGPNNALKGEQAGTDSAALATAKTLLKPQSRHGMATAQLLAGMLGKLPNAPGLGDYAEALQGPADSAAKGDLEWASRMLAVQAMTLDGIFAEMTRRMALNMGEYLGATQTYARIALKAQAGSRATIEALAKMHSPREQTVRHVHVNEGGQAVIADQFHHHAGGQENEKGSKQPHAQGARGSALPGPNPLGQPVPLPGDPGQEQVPDARGQRQRRT